jgi:hypothetical protein
MLPESDMNILKLLWKWKLLSTSALWTMLGKNDHLENTYQALRLLEKAKLIKLISFRHGMSLWTLSKLGFGLLQSELPSLTSAGSASEHMIHDFWVTVFHLGEWVSKTPASIALISEQELRRMPIENLPMGTPDPSKHRSDGYWISSSKHNQQQRIVGLEVERSLKPESIYKKYFDFYDLETSISCVVWPVSTAIIGNRIWKVLKSGFVFRPEIHYLVTTKDFVDLGWNALTLNTENQKPSVHSLLISKLVPNATQVGSNSNFKNLLDLRKKPLVSSTSESFQISKIPY